MQTYGKNGDSRYGCLRKNMYAFSLKHVDAFGKRRTRFSEIKNNKKSSVNKNYLPNFVLYLLSLLTEILAEELFLLL